MAESVLFSVPDGVRSPTNIYDCGRRVRYHQSEEVHLAFKVRRCHRADRYLKL